MSNRTAKDLDTLNDIFFAGPAAATLAILLALVALAGAGVFYAIKGSYLLYRRLTV